MSDYLERLQLLLKDPTSNLVAAALGVSIVALLLLILVLGLMYFALHPGPDAGPGKKRKVRRRKPTPEQLEAREQARLRAKRTSRLIVVFGLLLAWVALYSATSSQQYCTRTCHQMAEVADGHKASTHARVSCVRCHEGTLGVSLVTASASRVHSILQQGGLADSNERTVSPSRCLACHEGIASRRVIGRSAVAMSHREPLAAGASCTDCHGAQGHTEEGYAAGMQICLRCHDGKKASAKCETCHPQGAEASIVVHKQTFGSPVQLPERPTCGGCHSQTKCDQCHGLRMPHPSPFSDPLAHARLAAFEGKERICYRCHTFTDCADCHQQFTGHGIDVNWKQEHKAYKHSDGDTYCLWCHETKNFCDVCHKKE